MGGWYVTDNCYGDEAWGGGGGGFKASEVLRRRNFAKTGEEIVKLAALKQ